MNLKAVCSPVTWQWKSLLEILYPLSDAIHVFSAIFCATVKLWIWISSVQSAMETLSQGTEEEGVPRAKPQEHWNHHPSPPVLVMPLCNVGKALAVLCPCLVSLQPWPCEGITLRIQDRLAANACLTYHCLMLSEGQGEEVSLLTLRNCVDLVGINYVR